MLNKQREWIIEKVNYEEKKETYKKVGIGAAIGVGALALLGIGMKLGKRNGSDDDDDQVEEIDSDYYDEDDDLYLCSDEQSDDDDDEVIEEVEEEEL